MRLRPLATVLATRSAPELRSALGDLFACWLLEDDHNVLADPGLVRITARMKGFEPFAKAFFLRRGTTEAMTIELKPDRDSAATSGLDDTERARRLNMQREGLSFSVR